MAQRTQRSLRLLAAVSSLFVLAGCSIHLANLKEVDQPTEEQLRTSWRDYHTYCLGGYAILFQLKGDTIIQKEDDWYEVTSDEAASGCAGFSGHITPVTAVLGENDEIYGYLIYNYFDLVSALIIDPKTVRLFYTVEPKGP